jgi:hypothetical protein
VHGQLFAAANFKIAKSAFRPVVARSLMDECCLQPLLARDKELFLPSS